MLYAAVFVYTYFNILHVHMHMQYMLFLTQRVSLPTCFFFGFARHFGYRKGGDFAREPGDKQCLM